MRRGWIRFAVVALMFVGPMMIGRWYYRLEAPPDSGVYVETDHDYQATLVDADRALDVVPGYAPTGPGASASALHSPALVRTRKLRFFVVAPEGDPLLGQVKAAKLLTFAADGHNDDFRANAVELAATVTPINKGAYVVSSPELAEGWEAALKRLDSPRGAIEVLVGLELRDARGDAHLYSVRVGPPR